MIKIFLLIQIKAVVQVNYSYLRENHAFIKSEALQLTLNHLNSKTERMISLELENLAKQIEGKPPKEQEELKKRIEEKKLIAKKILEREIIILQKIAIINEVRHKDLKRKEFLNTICRYLENVKNYDYAYNEKNAASAAGIIALGIFGLVMSSDAKVNKKSLEEATDAMKNVVLNYEFQTLSIYGFNDEELNYYNQLNNKEYISWLFFD